MELFIELEIDADVTLAGEKSCLCCCCCCGVDGVGKCCGESAFFAKFIPLAPLMGGASPESLIRTDFGFGKLEILEE